MVCLTLIRIMKTEDILLSTKILKINEQQKKQKRIFLLTTRNIYNLSPHMYRIKRKISITKIHAVTCSKVGNEFVIHVPEEYDYRYTHADKRDTIILYLSILYERIHPGEQFHVHYRDEINLEPYTTRERDKEKGILKMPRDSGEEKTKSNDLDKELTNEEVKEDDPDKKRTITLFSQIKGQTVCLEDFTLLRDIGRGAFGTVLLVRKKSDNEVYAMKILKKKELIQKGQIEHTKTEKMILEHVNHPFIVNLIYCFTTPEKIFFVMKYMRGGELFTHLRREKRFNEERVKFYAAQVILALGHLHSKDIIYRDMKPENILMDEKGYISLTDFGMAKVLKEGVATTFCGTPEYLAPEIIKESGHDRMVDWWGLGILIYELLIGLPPFYHVNQNVMFELITEGEVRFPKMIKISDEVKDLISKCLIKDPAQRMGSQSDSEEFKRHPWFANMDWESLMNKTMKAPFEPELAKESENPNKYTEEYSYSYDPSDSYTSPMNSTELRKFDEEFYKSLK